MFDKTNGGRTLSELPISLYCQGAILFLAAIYLNFVLVHYTHFRAFFVPDSTTYIGLSSARTIGYPLLIELVRICFRDLRWMPLIQLNLLLLSYSALGIVVGRLSKNSWLGFSCAAISFFNYSIFVYTSAILSEAPFAAFVCLHVAAVGYFILSRTLRAAIAVGATMAAVILTRPAGYPVLLGIPLLLLLLRGETAKILKGMAGVSLGLLLLTFLGNFLRYGVMHGQSINGMSFIAHTANVIDENDGVGTKYEGLIRNIARRTAPIRHNIATLPFPNEYFKDEHPWPVGHIPLLRQIQNLNNKFYPAVYWGRCAYTINPMLIEVELAFEEGLGVISTVEPGQMKKINEASTQIPWIIIRHHPWAYMKHVAAHYYGMWQGFYLSAAFVPSYFASWYHTSQSLADRFGPLFKGYMDLGYLYDKETTAKFDVNSPINPFLSRVWNALGKGHDGWVALNFLASCVFLLALCLAKPAPLTLLLGYASFILNGYFWFVACLNAAIDRYSAPFAPIASLLLLAAVYYAGRLFLARVKSRNLASAA